MARKPVKEDMARDPVTKQFVSREKVDDLLLEERVRQYQQERTMWGALCRIRPSLVKEILSRRSK